LAFALLALGLVASLGGIIIAEIMLMANVNGHSPNNELNNEINNGSD
jgi:uncharacterized membrane protein YphA (DoxX/SURF4 family)